MRRLACLCLALVCFISVGGATAQDELPMPVTQFTLDNGLEVILVEDDSAPTVAVNMLYHVGGAYDPAGRSGFAHLFEHMMFEETAHLASGDIFNLVEATGGSLNAYTDADMTVYYAALPAHQLPLALWIEADRLASLVVDQSNFDNQRAIVNEEYNLRYANVPYALASLTLLTQPFDYAPYQKGTIGSVEELNAATIQDVIDFHSTYYVPNNATLVVAGEIDVEATRAMVEDLFGPIPRGPEPPTLPAYTPSDEPTGERMTVYDNQANVPALLYGYVIPPYTDADYPALEVAARILGQGASSRLTRSLVDTGLAAGAGAFTLDRSGPSLFAMQAIANGDVELDTLDGIIADELARLAEDGPSAEELDKTITQIRSERFFALESVAALAESVQQANFYFGDPGALFSEINRFRDVTAEDVQRVVTDYLTDERATVLQVLPGTDVAVTPVPTPVSLSEDESSEAEAPQFVIEQAEPPEPLPLSEFTLPEITETMLDNGLDVIVIPRPEIPIISLDIVFPGGESVTTPDEAGLANVAAYLLTRGTETRTAQEIAEAVEAAGGGFGAGASQDSLSAGIYALSEHTDLAFEMLGDMVMQPTFPESELEVYRQELLTSLRLSFDSPGALASRTFTRLIYGDHPYGELVTEDSIQALDREAVVDFYEAQVVPDNAFLVVAGDITPEDGVALAEATFGDWASAGVESPAALPEPVTPTEPGIYLVDRPGSTQAQFIIGELALSGLSDERQAAGVLNELFGGSASSRLFTSIREEQGYTYSIGSSFGLPLSTGTFRITAAVRNDVTGEALDAILAEVDRLRSEPVPEAELERTKAARIGRLALALETYQDFVNNVVSLMLRGEPLSALEDYVTNVEAVDQTAVSAVAQQYIDPDKFIIVVVGDAAVIQDQLETVGEVTVVEAQ